MKEELTVLILQEWWRTMSWRLAYLRKVAALKKIQRVWRASRYYRRLMHLYRKERTRKSEIFAKEKKFLLEKRTARKIIDLFAKSRHNSAKQIQTKFRKYLNEKKKKLIS